MTQIARTKGLLFGPAIDVYLSNNIAIMQGAVARRATAPQLAKVLALEPEVQQIDNHLVAIGPTRPMAEIPAAAKENSARRRAAGNQQCGDPSRGRPRRPACGAVAKFSGGSITITNPATNSRPSARRSTAPPIRSRRDIAKSCVKIGPGQSIQPRCEVGQVQYSLQSGQYSVTNTDHGWELYRSKLTMRIGDRP